MRMRMAAAIVAASISTAMTLSAAAQSPAEQSPPPPALSAAECAVWMRELSFARSVTAHDEAAFAEHLDSAAVFNAAGATPQRGRDAVRKAWAELIRGDGVVLDWYPARVAATGDLAWSSGPYLMTLSADGKTEIVTGTFHSIWRRARNGTWYVVFDAGGGGGRAATEAEIAAFPAGRKQACPGG